MGRTLHTDLTTHFEGDVVRPFFAVKVKLPNAEGTDVWNYLWTGLGTITLWEGDILLEQDFTGLGDIMTIGAVTENQDLAAKGITIELRTSTEFIYVTRDRKYQGNPITVYLGATDEDGEAIGEPFVFFDGFLDQMSYKADGKSVGITLTAEHKLIRLAKTTGKKYTHEDQIMVHSADDGFDLLTAIASREINWGE
jgi:hypothetical protein